MKILVTGSDGYIGIKLVQTLLEKGHDVVGFDTGYYRSGWLFNGVTKLPKTISKDIRKITLDDLKGFDGVVHLAELSNDPLGENDPKLTYKINHLGTLRLARLAKKAGVKRFVYSSSCSVYGASDEIRDEDSPTNPLTAYAKSKVLNEKALIKLSDKNFSPVILRNATVYGASPRLRFDLAVNNLTALAYITKKIKMESDGTSWRPFVHIDDVCKAFTCALTAPKSKIHNQIFNVGNNKSNYQIKDVAQIIKKTLPHCKVFLNKNGADKRNYKVNFDKISAQLPGFKSKRDVKTGVKELLAIFKKINLGQETFEYKAFTRLKEINYLRKTKQINKEFYWI